MRFSLLLMSTSRKWHNDVIFRPKTRKKNVLEISVFMFLFPFHLHLTIVVTQRLHKQKQKWMLLLNGCLGVCLWQGQTRHSAWDMLFLLRGVIPGMFYRLLTDISEIECDTPNDISWEEILTDTHLDKLLFPCMQYSMYMNSLQSGRYCFWPTLGQWVQIDRVSYLGEVPKLMESIKANSLFGMLVCFWLNLVEDHAVLLTEPLLRRGTFQVEREGTTEQEGPSSHLQGQKGFTEN